MDLDLGLTGGAARGGLGGKCCWLCVAGDRLGFGGGIFIEGEGVLLLFIVWLLLLLVAVVAFIDFFIKSVSDIVFA